MINEMFNPSCQKKPKCIDHDFIDYSNKMKNI